MWSEVEAENQHWYIASYSMLAKCVKMTKTSWKNSLIIAKDIRNNHIYVSVIAITFPQKKIGGITFVPPLIVTTGLKRVSTTHYNHRLLAADALPVG
jgi:hypothetical protein